VRFFPDIGTITGFKGGSSTKDKTVVFGTEVRAMKKDYVGSITVTIDHNDCHRLSGKYVGGMRGKGVTTPVRFTGTKAQ